MPDFSRALKTCSWVWLPVGFFLIGIVAVALLLVANRINEQRLGEAEIIDAIMDVQLMVTTAHLEIEEVLGGDASLEMERVFAYLDQAGVLITATLQGGATHHGWISEPIRDPALRSRVKQINSLLEEFRASSVRRLENPTLSQSASFADQQFDALFKTIIDETSHLADLLGLDKARNEQMFDRLFRMLLLVWTSIVVVATAGLYIIERKRYAVKQGLLTANAQLLTQADELTEHRERLAELVDRRTAELKAANELIQAEYDERLQTYKLLHGTEKRNSELYSRLLSAQEAERKRIAMELHDELGQALNVIKLQLRVLEQGSMDRSGGCEALLKYTDQVIEDVRRISRNLSPTVLEDLGLTSALHWLVDNLKIDPNLNITTDVETIDHLVSRKHWIVIYRVVQEALTNIVKHAHAGHVRFVTCRRQDRVVISVEDDGKGFDLNPSMTEEANAKGLGLTTMRERVTLIGGDYNLWSRTGEGTRISFSIPVNKSEAS